MNTIHPLNGADRFQLYFDTVTRNNTGTGNVIRAVVTVKGEIPEQDILSMISCNEAFRFIVSLSLKRKWYSPFIHFNQEDSTCEESQLVTFHREGSAQAIRQALSRDCGFYGKGPLHVDVIYEATRTHIIISASHVLMDHKGMENLLAALSGPSQPVLFRKVSVNGKNFIQKLAGAIRATVFVLSRSGWDSKRLLKKSAPGKPAFEILELGEDETLKAKLCAENNLKTNLFSFYLACSVRSIHEHRDILTGKGNYFVAVPVDRRPAPSKDVLLSNFISFIYFQLKDHEVKDLKAITQSVSRQMVSQAKKKIPEKFSSLLDLFRFIPQSLYRLFIELPGNGNAGTFAFSMLEAFSLANKMFMGFPVTDVTHYPPVITPPGLNMVFTEFSGRLKIILSFDEKRMTRQDALGILEHMKRNLTD